MSIRLNVNVLNTFSDLNGEWLVTTFCQDFPESHVNFDKLYGIHACLRQVLLCHRYREPRCSQKLHNTCCRKTHNTCCRKHTMYIH